MADPGEGVSSEGKSGQGRTVHESDEIGQMHGTDEGKVSNISGEKRLLLVDSCIKDMVSGAQFVEGKHILVES